MILITVKTCHGKRVYVESVFGYFGALMGAWGSLRCLAWPALVWMRGDGVVKVKGHHNVILNTFQKIKGKCIYFGSFLVILGL